jgi:hypothetical protein
MNIAQENIARALREEPLFATRQWLCRLRIHTWLKWGDPVKTRRSAYDYVEQYRICGCCGVADRKILSKD